MLCSIALSNHSSLVGFVLNQKRDPYTLSVAVDGTNTQINNGFPVLDSSYVEYFLDITVDKEIAPFDMATNSTLYKRETENIPKDLCAVPVLNTDPMDGE